MKRSNTEQQQEEKTCKWYLMECCITFGDLYDNDECKTFCEQDKVCCWNPLLYPTLSENWALVCNCINWFPLTAGVGTILSGLLTRPDGTSADCCSLIKIITMGLFQALFTPIIFGYIWSIKHGLWLYQLARKKDQVTKLTPSH